MKLNFNNQYDAINKLNTSAGVNTVHNSKNVNSLITNYNNIEIASNEINLEYNIKNIKNFYTILNNESTIKQINDQFKKIYDVTIGLFISVSKKTQIPSTMLRGYDNDTCKLNNVNAFIIVTNLRYNIGILKKTGLQFTLVDTYKQYEEPTSKSNLSTEPNSTPETKEIL